MQKLINQAITLAKDAEKSALAFSTAKNPDQVTIDAFVFNHQELLKKLRQLRTKICEPADTAKTPPADPKPSASIWPEADFDDQQGGWTIDPVFLQRIADSINIKTTLGPVLRFGLDFIEAILITSEKHNPALKNTLALKDAVMQKPLFLQDLVKQVMHNMTKPPKGYPQIKRWGAVAQTFGIGSTAACELCHYFGLDPDDVIR